MPGLPAAHDMATMFDVAKQQRVSTCADVRGAQLAAAKVGPELTHAG